MDSFLMNPTDAYFGQNNNNISKRNINVTEAQKLVRTL